jgi:hypothetical protein
MTSLPTRPPWRRTRRSTVESSPSSPGVQVGMVGMVGINVLVPGPHLLILLRRLERLAVSHL